LFTCRLAWRAGWRVHIYLRYPHHSLLKYPWLSHGYAKEYS
jgi:hypothetical protein